MDSHSRDSAGVGSGLRSYKSQPTRRKRSPWVIVSSGSLRLNLMGRPVALNIRWPDAPNDQEYRLQHHKLGAALAFARANELNRVIIDSEKSHLGIVTTGKSAP